MAKKSKTIKGQQSEEGLPTELVEEIWIDQDTDKLNVETAENWYKFPLDPNKMEKMELVLNEGGAFHFEADDATYLITGGFDGGAWVVVTKHVKQSEQARHAAEQAQDEADTRGSWEDVDE